MCPETIQKAGVEVDAKHAAITTAQGLRELQLKDCTRWPERGDCGQECLSQIEFAPEYCQVRTKLKRWYMLKPCAFCGKGFQEVDSYDHRAVFGYDKKPALLTPEGKILEWSDVPVEELPDVLKTHKPVCWDCHIAETFRREYPEMVVDRPWVRTNLYRRILIGLIAGIAQAKIWI